jgi:hypothetical protein
MHVSDLYDYMLRPCVMMPSGHCRLFVSPTTSPMVLRLMLTCNLVLRRRPPTACLSSPMACTHRLLPRRCNPSHLPLLSMC